VRSGGHKTPPEAARDFGDARALVALSDAAPYLALARRVLEPSLAPAAPAAAPLPLSPAPGRRVFLLFYPPPGGDPIPIAATANGPTLEEAVKSAALAMAPQVPPAIAALGRLELDVPTALEGEDLYGDMAEPLASIGLGGVFVTSDAGKSAFVAPGEIVQRGLFRVGARPGLDGDKLTHLLALRAKATDADVRAMRAYRFEVDAHVEMSAHDGALAVYRGMVTRPARPDQLSPELLLSAVKRGADYLVRVMSPAGRYVYMYRAAEDRDESSYGWLRHAGTTYALLEAYDEFRESTYAEKGELALSYLKAHLTSDPESQGKYVLDTNDEEQQKTGGAGLALLAFAKHAAVTGKRTELETMRALARFIMKQQYADGHFRSNADLDDASRRGKHEPI
jgi:hypothetical protein